MKESKMLNYLLTTTGDACANEELETLIGVSAIALAALKFFPPTHVDQAIAQAIEMVDHCVDDIVKEGLTKAKKTEYPEVS